MNIKDIDTSRFMFDPSSKESIELAKQHKEFKELFKDSSLVRNKRYLSFMCLMCDKNSDILKNRTLTYPQRKRMAAEAAGFKLKDGKFDKKDEDVILGKHERFNIALIKYLSLQRDADITQLAIYDEIRNKNYVEAYTSGDDKATKVTIAITEKIKELEAEIFGGEEKSSLMRQALYEAVGEKQLKLKPEDIANHLDDGGDLKGFGPYGDDYKPEDITFVSDTKPADF